MQTKDSINRLDLLVICCILLFGFSNIAIFYSLYSYLGYIGIPVEWRGWIVSLEPMTAFFLRPLIITMVSMKNATRMVSLACLMSLGALMAYPWAHTILALVLLRIMHGFAFVLLISGVYTILSNVVIPQKSARVFGLVGVMALLPYSLLPPLCEKLLQGGFDEAQLYFWLGALGIPVFSLTLYIQWKYRVISTVSESSFSNSRSFNAIKEDLKQPMISGLLVVSFLLYICYATVFYFIKSFIQPPIMADVGLFFSIFTWTMICIRVIFGKMLDRMDQSMALLLFSSLWGGTFLMIALSNSAFMLYGMAILYGVCTGVLFPILNAQMLINSPSSMRAINTNMVLFTMDAGYVFSSAIGGLILAAGYPTSYLFAFCVALIIFSVIILSWIFFRRK